MYPEGGEAGVPDTPSSGKLHVAIGFLRKTGTDPLEKQLDRLMTKEALPEPPTRRNFLDLRMNNMSQCRRFPTMWQFDKCRLIRASAAYFEA